MDFTLYVGDYAYSSWSLRGWLMMQRWGLPFRTHMTGLYAGTLAQDLSGMAPARTVPMLRTPEGHILSDTLAMAETLAERHPDLSFYPKDPAARALCRCLVAEMHSSFTDLRSDCPMQLRQVWLGFAPSEGAKRDLARIAQLWTLARKRHGAGGPWLFGEYSVADAFYAPVAIRITGYDLPVSTDARAYVDAHLTDPSFLAWREEAMAEVHDPLPYQHDLPHRPWPDAG